MPVKLIANALLFQASWFACVLGGTSGWLLIPLAALVIHFTWISSWAAEGKLVVSVMLAGTALDSFLLQMGVFSFPGDHLPIATRLRASVSRTIQATPAAAN